MTTAEVPASWQQFIADTLHPQLPAAKFPKKQLLGFLHSPHAPKVKQLLGLLPHLYLKYQQNCTHFQQLLILLYLLIIKGCLLTHQHIANTCMVVLEQLLSFRLVLVCGSGGGGQVVVQVWDYMENWLTALVPAILTGGVARDRKKGRADTQGRHSNRTLMWVLSSINKRASEPDLFGLKGPNQLEHYDSLLVLFEALLVQKIRAHLKHASLFEFDGLMRRIYTPDKYRLVYQGKGCITHIPNRDREKKDRERELAEIKGINLSCLVHSRMDQMSCQVHQLEFRFPQTEHRADENRSKRQSEARVLKLAKVESKVVLQPWVTDAFRKNTLPEPIAMSLSLLLGRVKPMEIYNFLSCLEIYGSSPAIEVLNEFIPDEKLLEFFTKFLLRENLVSAAFELTLGEDQARQILNSGRVQLSYCYKNSTLVNLIEECAKSTGQIETDLQKHLFISELKARIMGSAHQGSDANNRQGAAKLAPDPGRDRPDEQPRKGRF